MALHNLHYTTRAFNVILSVQNKGLNRRKIYNSLSHSLSLALYVTQIIPSIIWFSQTLVPVRFVFVGKSCGSCAVGLHARVSVCSSRSSCELSSRSQLARWWRQTVHLGSCWEILKWDFDFTSDLTSLYTLRYSFVVLNCGSMGRICIPRMFAVI